jgi:CheY-like chemotaxis protein
MADGGKLTIETANVVLDDDYCRHHTDTTSGRFVMLAVSDDGTGMSAETVRHIFEPFYTTKEQGQGTGLGLAMVYGAVHQNRGTIEVYSELGQGTTFKLYLPRIDERAEDIQPGIELESTTGDETIVLVEDDERVRALGARILRRQGYTVHTFSNGNDALDELRNLSQHVDLVITDVIMPGMNGKVFSERAQQLHPNIQVLFTSGYTQTVIVHHGVLDPGVQFLAKPYTYHGLTLRVRELLDHGVPQPCVSPSVS